MKKRAWLGALGARLKLGVVATGIASVGVATLTTSTALGQEPALCRSTDPSDHPDSSKPYFMLVVDTSGSMLACTNPTTNYPNPCPAPENTALWNSCGMVPSRLNDAKCALRQTVQAFGGEVNFGLATFAVELFGCNTGATACNPSCNDPSDPTGSDDSGCVAAGVGTTGEFYSASGCSVRGLPGQTGSSCGSTPDCNAGAGPPAPNLAENWANGGRVVVPMQVQPTWGPPPPPSNVDEVLRWFDNDCSDSKELFAMGGTPIHQALTSINQYMRAGWDADWDEAFYCPGNTAYQYTVPQGQASPPAVTFDGTSPLNALDRPCREVQIILVTDGAPTCGSSVALSSGAAAALFAGIQAPGGGPTFNIRTNVIAFAGSSLANATTIATAGGGVALQAQNEVQLSLAMSQIISGAIRPEVCDNTDNNCNGCTDEGFQVYCNRGKVAAPLSAPPQPGECCDWSNTAQRDACIAAFQASIGPGNPSGDQWLLPCFTDPGAANPEQRWLCNNPLEICDDADNNCDATFTLPPGTDAIDEGFNKCPNCPVPETCDGNDQNCDAIIDNAPMSSVPFSVCPGGCQSFPEICDGCDNDCNGIADDGVPPIACGFPAPPNCDGQRRCVSTPVANPGDCVPGGGTFDMCDFMPTGEFCDGLDNDCNGVIDDGVPPTACEDPGNPGRVYQGTFPQSQCIMGSMPCLGTCTGFVGPSPESCNGTDNDCDGVVDGTIPGFPGSAGTACVTSATCPGAQVCLPRPISGNMVCAIPPPGTGNTCGTTAGICTQGTTACVGGMIVCSGGTQPGNEVCNGLDDDCDGQTDEGLTDAPADSRCWSNPGATCTDPMTGVMWDPPPGAGCRDTGGLTVPCQVGTLLCGGGSGWFCQGDINPGAEICDGVDNDCDGTVDDGVPPPGTTCGTDVGECTFGALVCTAGVTSCVGGQGPTTEFCDGDDDDCDGVVDGTIPPSGPTSCTTNTDCAINERCLQRSGPADLVCALPPTGSGTVCGTGVGECTNGTNECVGGTFVCTGGTGSQPEVCDGLDNDCDGAIDDGMLADAPASLGCWQLPGSCCSEVGLQWCPPAGATCTDIGTLTAPCSSGTLVCQGGAGWACQGGRVPAPEVCDGVDNDCANGADDGNPGGGAQCGTSDVGECSFGSEQCVGGSIVCVGEVGPSPEVCDDDDDNCDGVDDGTVVGGTPCTSNTDCTVGNEICFPSALGGMVCAEPTAGVGNPCGLDTGQCQKGTTLCVGGNLICQGGTPPNPESCNGLDDDCDGFTDEPAELTDAPADPNCWSGAGTTCSHSNAMWDPPAGATCTGLGTLSTPPCQTGGLRCDGASGWSCVGDVGPTGEICDGVDNNCDGTADEGNPGGGAVCGSDVGECMTGMTVCVGGVLDCQGETGPQPEICDGLDNDCNGAIDNGIPIGGTCQVPYDTVAYPGDRTQGQCRPGVNECDGMGGLNCVGGIGPTAEICDGKDNDCDGLTDEPGPQPDGVDGTVNPLDSTQTIGDACGVDVGECKQGQLVCDQSLGQFVCEGSIGPNPERCDCADNDCDGEVDEDPEATEPQLCSPGKTCVATADSCQCAPPCGSGEFPCPTGTTCETVTRSGTTMNAGNFCIDTSTCSDCEADTVFDPQGGAVCGPAGTTGIDGKPTPVCVCQGQFGCQSPCFGIECPDPGQQCVPSGPATGTCRNQNNCNFFGCIAGEACDNGACVADPCEPNPCAPEQVCKPNSTFDDNDCVASCAGVTCPAGEECSEGSCVPTGCGVDCGVGMFCQQDADGGFACGPSRCMGADGGLACSNGAFCDPATGACGNDPCTAVKCPAGQECQAGECVEGEVDAGPGTGGAGGVTGTGGSGNTGNTMGQSDAGRDASAGTGGTTTNQDRRVFGLATGGGGCACRATSSSGPAPIGGVLLAGLVLGAFAVRRRRTLRAGLRKGVL